MSHMSYFNWLHTWNHIHWIKVVIYCLYLTSDIPNAQYFLCPPIHRYWIISNSSTGRSVVILWFFHHHDRFLHFFFTVWLKMQQTSNIIKLFINWVSIDLQTTVKVQRNDAVQVNPTHLHNLTRHTYIS